MKIQGLLLSYLTTALLVNSDKKNGRLLAKRQMQEMLLAAPEVFQATLSKYRVFMAMNRLHISKSTWDKVINTKIYNKLRKNHSFD